MNAARRVMEIVAVAGVVLLQVATVRAQENVWEGYPREGGTTDWFDAANWSQAALPEKNAGGYGTVFDAKDLVAIAANDDQVLIDSGFQVAEAVRINLWGSDTSGGVPPLLTIKSNLDLSRHMTVGSTGVGSGTVDHISGTVNVASDYSPSLLLLESGGTYNLYKNAVLNTLGSVNPSQLRGGTFNAYGGTLSVPNQGLAVGYSDIQTSTMTVSGGSTINVAGEFGVGYGSNDAKTSPHAVLRVIGANTITANWLMVGGWGTAEVAAVIDQTGFSPITAQGPVYYQWTSPDLSAELRGGVLLTTADHYDLFEGETVDPLEDWGSKPEGLWNTSIATVEGGRQAVRIQLDSLMQADTLKIGQQLSLGAGEGVEGYVTFNSLQQEQTLLELELGFTGEGSADETTLKGLVDDFTAGLSEAGYDWTRIADFEVGLDMTLALAAGEDTADFAWDMSEYQVNPQLELSTITVIPEPSTGMLVLAALGVAYLRRKLYA